MLRAFVFIQKGQRDEGEIRWHLISWISLNLRGKRDKRIIHGTNIKMWHLRICCLNNCSPPRAPKREIHDAGGFDVPDHTCVRASSRYYNFLIVISTTTKHLNGSWIEISFYWKLDSTKTFANRPISLSQRDFSVGYLFFYAHRANWKSTLLSFFSTRYFRGFAPFGCHFQFLNSFMNATSFFILNWPFTIFATDYFISIGDLILWLYFFDTRSPFWKFLQTCKIYFNVTSLCATSSSHENSVSTGFSRFICH